MPFASRIGTDTHICPMSDGPKPHVGGPIIGPGAATVQIGGMPAAKVMDSCTCASAPATIVKGSTGVFLCNMPAARQGDITAHGGAIATGLATVNIGEINMALMTPANIAIILGVINSANSVTNCADITTSVIALFRGNGPLIAPNGGGQTDEEINANNNVTIGPYNQSIAGIFAQVQAGGPGTVQVMTIDYPPPGGGGHVVAVANVNGQVGIMEGQDWNDGAQPHGFITDPAVANARYNPSGGTTFATATVP